MANLSHRIKIRATPHDVYRAITTVDGLKTWYTPDIEGEIVEGDSASFRFSDGERFQWEFSKLAPDSEVQWTCVDGPGSAVGTVVTFAISATDQGRTAVSCEHSGWPEGHDAMSICNTLWGIFLGKLKDFVELGARAHQRA